MQGRCTLQPWSLDMNYDHVLTACHNETAAYGFLEHTLVPHVKPPHMVWAEAGELWESSQNLG